MDNYVSPYGFSPVTDAVIDSVAGERDLATAFENLSEEERETIESAVDNWWKDSMSYAYDKMRDLLHDHLPSAFDDDD